MAPDLAASAAFVRALRVERRCESLPIRLVSSSAYESGRRALQLLRAIRSCQTTCSTRTSVELIGRHHSLEISSAVDRSSTRAVREATRRLEWNGPRRSVSIESNRTESNRTSTQKLKWRAELLPATRGRATAC